MKRKGFLWKVVQQMLAILGVIILAVLVVGCENPVVTDETTDEQNDPGGGDETDDDVTNDDGSDNGAGGGIALDVSGTIQGVVDPYTGDVSTYSPDVIEGLPEGTYFVGLESENESATWYPSVEQNQVGSDDDFSITLPVPDTAELLTATDAFGSGVSSSSSDARFDLAYFGVGTSEDDGLSLSLANRENNGTITYVQYIYASEATILSGSSSGDEGTSQYSSITLEAGWNAVVVNADIGAGLFGQIYDVIYVDDSVPTELQWLIVDNTTKLVSPNITFTHVEQQGDEYDTEILITQGADSTATPPTADLYMSFGIWHTNPSPVVPDGNYVLNTGGSTGDGARMGAVLMGSDAVESDPLDFNIFILEAALEELEAGSVTYDTYLQATAGTVTVADQGSGSYTVSWEITLSNGVTITGEATGTAELDYGDLVMQ